MGGRKRQLVGDQSRYLRLRAAMHPAARLDRPANPATPTEPNAPVFTAASPQAVLDTESDEEDGET